MLGTSDEPLAVAGEVVEALRRRENGAGFVKLDQRPHFSMGQKIRVLEGVFTDLLGLYDGMPDHDRVAVLLDLLGRKVRILVDAEAVAAA